MERSQWNTTGLIVEEAAVVRTSLFGLFCNRSEWWLGLNLEFVFYWILLAQNWGWILIMEREIIPKYFDCSCPTQFKLSKILSVCADYTDNSIDGSTFGILELKPVEWDEMGMKRGGNTHLWLS